VSVGDGELEAIAGYHRRRHHGIAGYDEIIGDLGNGVDVGAAELGTAYRELSVGTRADPGGH
jgi:hypothetical protein